MGAAVAVVDPATAVLIVVALVVPPEATIGVLAEIMFVAIGGLWTEGNTVAPPPEGNEDDDDVTGGGARIGCDCTG